ncbi:glycosyltransferase [Brevundimonas sp. SPF441]|nr:glycosyltransferase [Brevundimonas sp. SPF441]
MCKPCRSPCSNLRRPLPASGSFAAPLPLPIYPERKAFHGPGEWTFITPRDSKGWILDAICREIGGRQEGAWEVVYGLSSIPEARNYFFSHYWNYLDAIKKHTHILDGNVLVWYTHPRDIPYSIDEQVVGFNKAHKVLFTCSEYRDLWLRRGVRPEKAVVILGGADPHLFLGHERRGGNVVGLSASFYERKNPDALLEVVSRMPERDFALVGRKWEEYSRFSELKALKNFTYIQATYEQYPSLYREFDVFLSMAMLEGGPIPLIEAMMENVVPVASRTGFAPDLIDHGVNGYLFPVGAGADVVAPLIDAAFSNRADIRRTVLPYSWDEFALAIHALCEKHDAAASAAGGAELSRRDASPANAREFPAPDQGDVEKVRRFSKLSQIERNSEARLAAALSRVEPTGAKQVVVVTGASSLQDIGRTPALSQLAEVGLDLDLLVATGNQKSASLFERDLRFSALDGLVEVSAADVEACIAKVVDYGPVAVIPSGAELSPETASKALALVEAWHAGDHLLEHDGARLRIPARSAHPKPRLEPIVREIAPALRLEAGGGLRIAVDGPAGPRTIVRRSGGRRGRVLELPTPLDLVKNTPSRLRWAAGDESSMLFSGVAGNLAPDMVRAYLNRGGAGNPIVEAFANAIGAQISHAEDQADDDATGVSVVWGVLRGSDKVIARARRDGKPFYYIDHAYFGRGHGLNYRISRDSYDAGPVRVCPPDRLEALGVQPRSWRSAGDTILVCPPTQFFCDAHGCADWLQQTMREIRHATDRPIEVRAKPVAGQPVEPLDNAFERAWAIVTHSSNVAVEAVVAGVPVFVSEASAAAPVGETDLSRIEVPRRPDRSAWLAHLAYSQFSAAEIGDGRAWRLLLENESRELHR